MRVPALIGSLHNASGHAHERADGAWHAEWMPLRELVSVVGGAAARAVELLDGLTVNPVRMRENLDRSGGAIMAESVASRLSEALGRAEAQRLVAAVVRQAGENRTPLRDALLAEPKVAAHLDAAGVDEALDPRGRLGIAGIAVDEAVRRHGRRTEGRR
jgi:3-carboxy-cis,cis-muconate cycloisomerase